MIKLHDQFSFMEFTLRLCSIFPVVFTWNGQGIKLKKRQVCKPNALTFDASLCVWLNFWIRIWLTKPLNMTICSLSSFISWLLSNMLTSVSCGRFLENQESRGEENFGEDRNSSSSTSQHFETFTLIFLASSHLLLLEVLQSPYPS